MIINQFPHQVTLIRTFLSHAHILIQIKVLWALLLLSCVVCLFVVFVCVCSLLFVVYSLMYLLLMLLLYLLLCVGSIIICFLINAGGLLCSRAVFVIP